MPTDLAFKLAARQAIFDLLVQERGEGWWGNEAMADYYAQKEGSAMNWIKGHPLMTPEIMAKYPFDHAGEGETSLMLALCPEAVDMKRRSKKRWYSRSAAKASRKTGERGRDLILAHMRQVLAT